MRLFGAVLASLVALWLLLAATLAWLATRPDALQRALDLVGSVATVEVEATGARGTLAGPFTIERLHVRHARAVMLAEGIEGELRLGSLLHGTLGISRLSVRQLRVEVREAASATEPGFLPAWLRIGWEQLAVGQLEIGGSVGPVVIHELSSTGSLTRWTLRSDRLGFTQGPWHGQGALRLQAGLPTRVHWTGALEGPVLPNGPSWQVSGTVDGVLAAPGTTPWRFAGTTARPQGLQASGELRLAADGWRVQGRLAATAVDLTAWGAGEAGRLSGQVSGQVAGPLGITAVAPLTLELSGQLSSTALSRVVPRGLRFQLRGETDRERWRAHELRLDLPGWGQLGLRGQGPVRAGPAPWRFEGRWRLPAADWLNLRAEVRQTGGGVPDWRLTLHGESIDWRRLPGIRSAGALPAGGPGRIDLRLAARGRGFAPPTGDRGHWQVEELRVTAGQSRLDFRGDWRGSATWHLRFATRELAAWIPGRQGHLDLDVAGTGFSPGGGDFQLHARTVGMRGPAGQPAIANGEAVVRGHWQPGALRGELSALTLGLEDVPPPLRQVRLRVPVDWQWQDRQLRWRELCLQSPPAAEEPWTACADARLAADRWALQGRVTARQGLAVAWQAEVQPLGAWRDWPLQGQLDATLPALDFLPTLFDDLDRVAGKVTAAVTLGGTLGLPDYRGSLRLTGGELDFVPANLRLRAAEALLTVAPGELRLSGQAATGEGRLEVDGEFRFGESGNPRDLLQGAVRLRGERLLLASVPEARILASPDLKLQLSSRGLHAEGVVHVPEARLAPPDLTGVVLPSPDERLRDVPAASANRLPVTANLQLRLGDRVDLTTLGLSGRLQGQLLAMLPTSGATTARGELSLAAGKFKAYTRELDIERGRLLFNGGPLSDPGLDLRAARQFPGVKAGVLVRGSLRRPLVRFFSDPARSQSEVASLLLVGRSLEGLQGTGGLGAGLGAGTASARDSILQQGGALVAAQLGQYVGLDEVQLERDTNDAASLVLGKYLSPRLYVSYGVGLTEALNTLKLRYTLGRRWVIRTEAGTRQSIDLEYSTAR
ncbi:MAG: translocation/assembly module TamB domain-containing protein [Gammaproteobacteria bacterium]